MNDPETQKFIDELNKFCQEHGYSIAPDVQLRRQFDGSYTLAPVLNIERPAQPVTKGEA